MIDTIIDYVKTNPVLSGVVGVYLATQVSTIVRGVPNWIINFIAKHLTTTFAINNKNMSFFEIMKMLEEDKVSDKVRSVRILNGMWSYNTEVSIKGIGIGSHITKIRNKLVKISISEDNSLASQEKLLISIQYLGRNHKFMDSIISEIKLRMSTVDSSKTKMLSYDKGWGVKRMQTKRMLDNVILSEENERVLIEAIDKFIASREWYEKHNIPYTLGILLEGPPGTGKTSLIKAIAAKYDYAVAILDADQIGKLEDAMSGLPDKAIMVIEDIDRYLSALKGISLKMSNVVDENGNGDDYTAGISSMLNAIDGCITIDGRILIATANKIQDMDHALMRPGRFDLKMHIGYVDEYMFNKFMSKFFDEYSEKLPFNKQDLTIAELQNDILTGNTFSQFVDKYTIKETP